MIVFRPRPAFAFSHPAHFIAFGFGVGLVPWAPGTAGTLLAFPIWWLLGPGYPPAALFALIALLFVIGIWACELTGKRLGIPDHGALVWDEVVAFLLVLAIVPNEWPWQAAAFAVFRFFDIVKPPPIRWLERRYHGGFGVMFDDLIAAGFTLVVLAAVKRIVF
jgi:phosphatidylglycerophosphatase A